MKLISTINITLDLQFQQKLTMKMDFESGSFCLSICSNLISAQLSACIFILHILMVGRIIPFDSFNMLYQEGSAGCDLVTKRA